IHQSVDLTGDDRNLLLRTDRDDREDHVVARAANVADGETVRAGPDGRPFRQVVEGAVDRVTAPVVDDRELVPQLRREGVDQDYLQGAREVDVAVDDELAVLRAGCEAADLLVEGTGN